MQMKRLFSNLYLVMQINLPIQIHYYFIGSTLIFDAPAIVSSIVYQAVAGSYLHSPDQRIKLCFIISYRVSSIIRWRSNYIIR